MPPDELTRKLGQRADKEFMYLQRRINPGRRRARSSRTTFPGVFSQREFRRFYPQGEAMAHVLGFTNIDDRGQEGLELAFDEWLRGKPGAKRVIRDRQGRIVENVDLMRAAEPGQDLTLTHRPPHPVPGLPRAARALLENRRQQRLGGGARRRHRRSAGDGQPADATTRTRVDGGNPDTHRNRAVTDVVEPGSTMKPLTVAAALEAGVDHAGHDRSTPTRAGCRTAATAPPTTTTTACSTPPA